jgi:queuine tRNA-ribosyltransferase subunit QTRTD1
MPEEVLHAVEMGIDVFGSVYPYTLSVGGFALTFPVDILHADTAASLMAHNALSGQDTLKINLYSLSHRTDRQPFLVGCPCLACTRHNRAYVHHLLNTHEMLGQTLLDMYAPGCYLKFP